jgi:hypothetical protein
MSYKTKHWEIKIEQMPQYDNKYWTKIYLLDGEFIPSFEFLYYLLKGLGFCEDKKYPNGKGRHMITDFVIDALETEQTFRELRNKYQIPKR